MRKDTEQLENELVESKNFEEFFSENEENFQDFTLEKYLSYLLAEKNLSKNKVINDSELNPIYAYHIFAGRKKNPARPKILSLALAMKLSIKETQYLLYYAGLEKLYIRNEWDSIIMYALEKKLSVKSANVLLDNFSEKPLLGDMN